MIHAHCTNSEAWWTQSALTKLQLS